MSHYTFASGLSEIPSSGKNPANQGAQRQLPQLGESEDAGPLYASSLHSPVSQESAGSIESFEEQGEYRIVSAPIAFYYLD